MVFPAADNLSWDIPCPAPFISGIEKIIDFRAGWTSGEAGFEPPTSSEMLRAEGVWSPIPVICENQVKICYLLGWKWHIGRSVKGTSKETQAIRKRGAILAEWSQCELKSWWRAHLPNQMHHISLWRPSPWSNPRWQRIRSHFCQSGWFSSCKSRLCFQWGCEEHQDQANFHLGDWVLTSSKSSRPRLTFSWGTK